MEIEIWEDIPGYDGLYQASTLGRVRSFNYKKRQVARVPKILRPSFDNGGYLKVSIYKNKKHLNRNIHKLVVLTFIGPSNGLQVNHKNGIKSDSRLENLEYITCKENVAHALKTGLIRDRSGERSHNHKLLETDVQYIRNYPKHKGYVIFLMNKFNVVQSTIYAIRAGSLWKELK